MRLVLPTAILAASAVLAACGSDSSAPSSSTPPPTTASASTSTGVTKDVDTFVCEFGNATIRPTIFSCTDKANGTEFSVDEA